MKTYANANNEDCCIEKMLSGVGKAITLTMQDYVERIVALLPMTMLVAPYRNVLGRNSAVDCSFGAVLTPRIMASKFPNVW